MTWRFDDAAAVMDRALMLAARGIGSVEPNPCVGAVLVDAQLNAIAEGWHQRFGGPHAEIEVLRAAGDRAKDATLFVTLEPCCHQGKTGPCTEAILKAGIRQVVIAIRDPFPEVNGKGIERLVSQGIQVDVGLRAEEAGRLLAPFSKLVTTGRPWVHAKWAMSLDGKIATHSGDSRWISNEASAPLSTVFGGGWTRSWSDRDSASRRSAAHGAAGVGPRIAARVVVDSEARLPITSQLVQSAHDVPVLVAASQTAPPDNVRRLKEHGVEVLAVPSGAAGAASPVSGRGINLDQLLTELGRRRFTNILVEGGSRLFGSLFDGGHVDEVHVFVAPKSSEGPRPRRPSADRGWPVSTSPRPGGRLPSDRWGATSTSTGDGLGPDGGLRDAGGQSPHVILVLAVQFRERDSRQIGQRADGEAIVGPGPINLGKMLDECIAVAAPPVVHEEMGQSCRLAVVF